MVKRRRRRADPMDMDWLLLPFDALASFWRGLLDALRQDKRSRWALALFVVAALLRVARPDWYSDRLFHPDERWLFDKTAELHLWAEPGKTDGAGMQYGTLPLYTVSVVKDFMHAAFNVGEHHASVLAGRTLTGLVDSLTVVATFALAAQLLGLGWALLAALLVAGSPLHIQLAHFFTVDPWLALFATATLAACVRLARRPSLGLSAGIGVLYAAALASKSSGLPLLAPIVLAHLWGPLSPGLAAKARQAELKRAGLALAVAAGSTLVAFFIFMPWAFLNFHKFLANQTAQQDILVKGSPGGVPFVRQYWDTGFGFHLKNIVFFYLGLPAGLLALIAAPWLGVVAFRRAVAAWRPAPKLRPRKGEAVAPAPAALWSASLAPLLLLAWALPYFIIVGSSFAKFARYMLPILPVLSVLLVMGLAALAPARARLARGLAWTLALFALGHGLGYGLTYLHPHPWIDASRWIYAHVPAQTADAAAPGGMRPTRILNEDWGDDLPVEVDGQSVSGYQQLKGMPGQVNIVEWDSANKLERLCNSLSQADVLMLADPRAYGTYLRLPVRFPLTNTYYNLLFSDPAKLGFEKAYESSNPVKVFGLIPLPDSRIPSVPRWLWADESFTLYDRPHTYIFRRIKPLSPDEVRTVLMDSLHARGLSDAWMRGVGPEDLYKAAHGGAVPGVDGADLAANDPAKVNPNYGQDRGAMHPLLQPVLIWWLLITVLGWLALPLCVRVFEAWPAGGYALSKALGVFLFGWLAYNLALFKLLRFTQGGLWLLLAALAAFATWRARRQAGSLRAWFQRHRDEIVFTEAVFGAAFLFFVVVRAYNPNIHDIMGQGYFGGGEPLGMTYLSALTRCVTFPAYDPWLALHNSSYYYFGYVLAAALTKLSGFQPAITYNLSLALFFSLALVSAFGLLRGLVAKRWLALGGAAMVALAGSLWTVAYLAIQAGRGYNLFGALFSHGFIWDPTRFPELVNGHIFEFPYFSYLYSDLHPHNMVVAFSLLLLALLAAPFLSAKAGWRSLGATPAAAGLWLLLSALLLDGQYAINTWSWPVYLALGAGALAIGPWAGKGLRPVEGLKAAAQGLGLWAVAALLGRALMAGFRHYFLQSGGDRLGHVLPQEWQMSTYIPLAFFLPGFVALAVLAGERLRDYSLSQAKLLGWAKLGRRDGLDRILTVIERLFDKRLFFGISVLVWAGTVKILLGMAAIRFSTQGVFVLSLGLGLACVGFFLLRGYQKGSEAFLWLLGGFTCFLVAGTEKLFVADRMNTIFKFWFNGWILMGVVFGAGLAHAFSGKDAPAPAPRRRGKQRRLSWAKAASWIGGLGLVALIFGAAWLDARLLGQGGRFLISFLAFAGLLLALTVLSAFYADAPWLRAGLRGVWIALLGLGLLYPLGATGARIGEASGFTHPHLDGLAFMAERDARPGYDAKDYDRHDYALIRWLNEHASVTETLLEAPGIELYKGYNRYAIYTGLPTLLGWDYQVGQQLGERTGGLLNQRKADAVLIYNGTAEQAIPLLKQYRVRWIVVGDIERKLYGQAGLDKFGAIATVAAQDGPSVLYRFEWDKP